MIDFKTGEEHPEYANRQRRCGPVTEASGEVAICAVAAQRSQQ